MAASKRRSACLKQPQETVHQTAAGNSKRRDNEAASSHSFQTAFKKNEINQPEERGVKWASFKDDAAPESALRKAEGATIL